MRIHWLGLINNLYALQNVLDLVLAVAGFQVKMTEIIIYFVQSLAMGNWASL
jgi:hypothetical protein